MTHRHFNWRFKYLRIPQRTNNHKQSCLSEYLPSCEATFNNCLVYGKLNKNIYILISIFILDERTDVSERWQEERYSTLQPSQVLCHSTAPFLLKFVIAILVFVVRNMRSLKAIWWGVKLIQFWILEKSPNL